MQAIDVQTTVLRIRFVAGVPDGDVALMAFNDPAPGYAIVIGHSANSNAAEVEGSLDVVLLAANAPQPTNLPDTPTIFVKYRGVELAWRPGHATLQCDPGQADALLPALVEFAHYEGELRRIETEIAAGWKELEQDKALAFEVTPTDLARSEVVGARMNRAFGRRIRYARIEPRLYEADAALSAAGQKLGAELREKARVESRLETVDAQLEVYEHVYEMSSQRLGEYRASREEHTLEWIIIVLLAAELFALLAQMLWAFKR
jgi:hypothetical protein